METKSQRVKLPTITEKSQNCSFNGYDAISLMTETAKLRRLITLKGKDQYRWGEYSFEGYE